MQYADGFKPLVQTIWEKEWNIRNSRADEVEKFSSWSESLFCLFNLPMFSLPLPSIECFRREDPHETRYAGCQRHYYAKKIKFGLKMIDFHLCALILNLPVVAWASCTVQPQRHQSVCSPTRSGRTVSEWGSGTIHRRCRSRLAECRECRTGPFWPSIFPASMYRFPENRLSKN